MSGQGPVVSEGQRQGRKAKGEAVAFRTGDWDCPKASRQLRKIAATGRELQEAK